MVRPESIRIATTLGKAPGHELRGRILQTSFLGNQTRVAVACEGVATPVLASLFGRDQLGERDLKLDQEVTLWWEPEAAVLLPETNSAFEQEEEET